MQERRHVGDGGDEQIEPARVLARPREGRRRSRGTDEKGRQAHRESQMTHGLPQEGQVAGQIVREHPEGVAGRPRDDPEMGKEPLGVEDHVVEDDEHDEAGAGGDDESRVGERRERAAVATGAAMDMERGHHRRDREHIEPVGLVLRRHRGRGARGEEQVVPHAVAVQETHIEEEGEREPER